MKNNISIGHIIGFFFFLEQLRICTFLCIPQIAVLSCIRVCLPSHPTFPFSTCFQSILVVFNYHWNLTLHWTKAQFCSTLFNIEQKPICVLFLYRTDWGYGKSSKYCLKLWYVFQISVSVVLLVFLETLIILEDKFETGKQMKDWTTSVKKCRYAVEKAIHDCHTLHLNTRGMSNTMKFKKAR